MSKAEEKPVSEYGEPWKVASPNKVINSNGATIASAVVSDKCRRIVACVNAMQGIPNPEAVRELIDAAKEWDYTMRSPLASEEEVKSRLMRAVAALSAPSTGAQQKGE